MSLYTLIESPVPTIAYCALHQARPDIAREEYMKTMKELHQRIGKETRAINSAFEKFLSDTIAKESQSLRNTLAQFLQTPISSDSQDVQSILVESFERLKGQVLGGSAIGLAESLESKVFFVSSKKALEKKLLKNGREYLENLGFNTIKGSSDIFESTFVVNGGMNLDILEHIVRDRLGIYYTTHGKHIKEFSGYAYAAYNLAFAKGKLPANDKIQKYTELTFHFSKPDVKYTPFRAGLSEAFEKLHEVLALDYISLWQRKLGLGAGLEFNLRIVSDNAEAASEVLQWLNLYEGEPFVRGAIIDWGNLVVKELLFR